MITPAEIKQKAERNYIAYLQSTIAGNSFFPLVIVGNKKPDENAVRFENELTELINHSYEKKGYGHLQQDSHFSIYKSFSTRPFVQVVVRDCEVVILDGSLAVILSGAKNLVTDD